VGSWVDTLVDGIVAELRSDQQTGFIPPLVHAVARVAVVEAARRCDAVKDGCGTVARDRAREAILAMLTEEVPRG
jgi:hypothetical protein